MHIYEVRPRKDHRGVDLIGDALPSVGCGMTRRIMQSATRRTTVDQPMLCVYDDTGNVIETHHHAGDFRKP